MRKNAQTYLSCMRTWLANLFFLFNLNCFIYTLGFHPAYGEITCFFLRGMRPIAVQFVFMLVSKKSDFNISAVYVIFCLMTLIIKQNSLLVFDEYSK